MNEDPSLFYLYWTWGRETVIVLLSSWTRRVLPLHGTLKISFFGTHGQINQSVSSGLNTDTRPSIQHPAAPWLKPRAKWVWNGSHRKYVPLSADVLDGCSPLHSQQQWCPYSPLSTNICPVKRCRKAAVLDREREGSNMCDGREPSLHGHARGFGVAVSRSYCTAVSDEVTRTVDGTASGTVWPDGGTRRQAALWPWALFILTTALSGQLHSSSQANLYTKVYICVCVCVTVCKLHIYMTIYYKINTVYTACRIWLCWGYRDWHDLKI